MLICLAAREQRTGVRSPPGNSLSMIADWRVSASDSEACTRERAISNAISSAHFERGPLLFKLNIWGIPVAASEKINIERLRAIWALVVSGSTEGERDNARGHAEKLLERHGHSLSDVPKLLKRKGTRRKTTTPPDWYDQWEDQVRREKEDLQRREEEAREAERKSWHAKWQAEHKAEYEEILARFGSSEQVFKLNAMEEAILESVKPWRFVDKTSHPGYEFVNWRGRSRGDLGDWADDILDAIKGAVPMPQTLAEAMAEADVWDALGHARWLVSKYETWDAIEETFEPPVSQRDWLIRKLADRDMPAETLEDVIHRTRRLANRGYRDDYELELLLADLMRVQSASAAGKVEDPCYRQREDVQNEHPRPPLSARERRVQIERILQTEKGRAMSLRQIARMFGASPATVLSIRNKIEQSAP